MKLVKIFATIIGIQYLIGIAMYFYLVMTQEGDGFAEKYMNLVFGQMERIYNKV